MLRRDFIKVSAASAALWPLAARAQPFKSPVRIGFLPLGSPTNAYDRSLVEAFRRGLRQIGLVEEKDIALNVTWITGDPEKPSPKSSSAVSISWSPAVQAPRSPQDA
jgi:putative ABC transport system substrate-binding protein